MSKPNKVNKSNYDQGGRLTPDELARERDRQGQFSGNAKGKEDVIGGRRQPPGPAGRASTPRRSGREE
jgi:hypothetical protein